MMPDDRHPHLSRRTLPSERGRRQNQSPSSSTSSLLREPRRRLRRRAGEEGKAETNDDGDTVLPLRPFSFRLTDLPPDSPILVMADVGADDDERYDAKYPTTDSSAIDALLEFVADAGARAFGESEAYGGRFVEWDVGGVWSVHQGCSSVPEVRRSLETATSSSSYSSSSAGAAAEALLTLGHNGTVTLRGIFLEDEPEPEELTEYLVGEMNSDGVDAEELMGKLRPLVCGAGDLVGSSCNAKVEVTSDVIAAAIESPEESSKVEEEEEEEEEDAQNLLEDAQGNVPNTVVPSEIDATNPTNTPGDETNTKEAAPIPIDEVLPEAPADFVDTSTNIMVASTPSDSRYSGVSTLSSRAATKVDNTPSQVAVPVVVGAAALALLVAGLLYRRKRNRRRKAAMDERLNATDDVTHAEEPTSPSSWMDAYDAIASPRMPSFHRSNAAKDSRASAAANAAAADDPAKKASRTLDEVLNSFSDGDSSYLSDSSAGGDTLGNSVAGRNSVVSCLTTILGGSPNRDDSRPRDEEDPDGERRSGAAKKANADGGSRSVQKQEDFEGAYRARSAAAMGLRKDMLHVACDAVDVPAKDGRGAGAVSSAAVAGNRTVSPRKSASMTKKQRRSEERERSRLSRAARRKEKDGAGGGKRDDGDARGESPKDWILPVGFRRSDSVDLESRAGGSDEVSSEDDVARAYV